jgi:hypothetical protein
LIFINSGKLGGMHFGNALVELADVPGQLVSPLSLESLHFSMVLFAYGFRRLGFLFGNQLFKYDNNPAPEPFTALVSSLDSVLSLVFGHTYPSLSKGLALLRGPLLSLGHVFKCFGNGGNGNRLVFAVGGC